MRQVTHFVSATGPFFKARRLQQAALLLTILVCTAKFSWAQTAASPQAQPPQSLAEPLDRAFKGQTQLHIFYVHGMGIETPKNKSGTQDFEVSQEFRTHFCKLIHCTKNEFEGRDYADEAAFDPKADPPPLFYLGKDLWKKSPSNDDWHAAAPFVDHYKLVRQNNTPIYVDEINWWPLIMSAKCRQILAPEAALVDLDEKHFKTCSAATAQDDPNHPDRYKSYAWITGAPKRDPSWPAPAVINRSLKHDILDWGFADALLAVGPMRQYLIEGIREIVLHSYNKSENQEFVVVSHSLGSFLMFSALDLQNDQTAAAAHPQWITDLGNLLSRTSHAYFMANQIRLLELANLDDTKNGTMITHLESWNNLRVGAHQPSPQIVAWSDPDDLLTWKVPDLDQDAQDANANHVTVKNRPAQNAVRWLWLLESPEGAHTKYDQNKRVLRQMVPKSKPHPTQKSNGASAVAPTTYPEKS